MTSPPSRPLHPWPQSEWIRICAEWQSTQNESLARRLQLRQHLLQPLFEDCLRSVSARHALLVDEPTLLLNTLLFIEERSALPSSLFSCRILLESYILKSVKEDVRRQMSDLRDPMAPWHSLRMQVNHERLRARRYFLSFLPRSDKSSAVDRVMARIPSGYWARMWDRFTEGIPASCIPKSWAAIRRTVSVENASRRHKHIQFIHPPQCDWKKLLAEPLHRAGALVEFRKPGFMGLSLPDGVLPRDPQRFAIELEAALMSRGGLPKGDANLLASLEHILAWRGGESTSSSVMSAGVLLQQAEALGFCSFKSHSLLSMTAARAGCFKEARLLLEKSLSHCSSPREIAAALGNIAGVLMNQGEYTEAMRYLQNALAYNPSSTIVRHNLALLTQALSASGHQGGAKNA